MGFIDALKRFFGFGTPSTSAPSAPSASDVMREMRSEKRHADPEWEKLRNRFATLVLSESDRQRVWRRAHRGAETSARLLSGISVPTPDEKRRLGDVVRELEAGR